MRFYQSKGNTLSSVLRTEASRSRKSKQLSWQPVSAQALVGLHHLDVMQDLRGMDFDTRSPRGIFRPVRLMQSFRSWVDGSPLPCSTSTGTMPQNSWLDTWTTY